MFFRRLTAAVIAAAVSGATSAVAAPLFGQPSPGGIGMQPGVTDIQASQSSFHNFVLMPVITVITLFVLTLLLWVVFRYNKTRNPQPARFTHNTTIEVIWTVAPVLMLMFIAIFSFRLLFQYHDMPTADLTIKATGYQWYWTYEYPDQEIAEFVSNPLDDAEAKAQGKPRMLGTNAPMVVPVNRNVRILTTGADVIHAFAMPAFGLKADSVPGRVNELWFKAERVGAYYGQCSELCGPEHSNMPIEVRVVPQGEFDAWVGRQRVAAGLPATIQPAAVVTPPAGAVTAGAPAAPAAAPSAPVPPAPAVPDQTTSATPRTQLAAMTAQEPRR